MEWFINACAIILLACVTTVMVSLTLAGVALLLSKVKKEVGFVFESRPPLTLLDLSKRTDELFNEEYNKYRHEALRRGLK